MKNGYIKIHRRLLDWEYYNDPSIKAVWLHLLLTASRKPWQYGNIKVPSGSVVSTMQEIARECGVTERQARRAIDKLRETGEITAHRGKYKLVISIGKWKDYQVKGDRAEKEEEPAEVSEKKRELTEEEKEFRLKYGLPI